MKRLPPIIFMMLSLSLGYFIGANNKTIKPEPFRTETIIHRDTIVDTIKYRQPVPVDSVVLRYETVCVTVTDTLRVGDEVKVEIPITQKEYVDTLYHAWVSGYHPNLDSIKVFSPTINITERVSRPPDRWGIGVQAGVGINGNSKITPYIGIGISYNIVTW